MIGNFRRVGVRTHRSAAIEGGCGHPPYRVRHGITLVEMLIAMAITLLMMAAVVTLFANISSSVSKRRATIEMSTQMQQVRAMLQRDLAGATCPAVPWQRPESNQGYIELIEGAQSDANPSQWIFDSPSDSDVPDGVGSLVGIDLAISSLPSSNLGRLVGSEQPIPASAVTDCRGLGDADDILMFTVRNEKEPFVGRAPAKNITGTSSIGFPSWGYESIESQLAEVVWYAVENPPSGTTPQTFYFGEAGYRTIYRRTLLIAPQLNFSFRISSGGNDVVTGPGVLRVLNDNVRDTHVDTAIAALIAFQEKYDVSARVEWDPLLPGGRWKIVANTLGDLTKRENRYEHHGVALLAAGIKRVYPYAAATAGANFAASTDLNVAYVVDSNEASISAPINEPNVAITNLRGSVVATQTTGRNFSARPLVRPTDVNPAPFALRAILDENGRIVHLTRGIAPLGNSRRGEDVVMSDALAFDMRVFDPGAPLYEYYPDGNTSVSALTVVQPGDPGWAAAYERDALTTTAIGDLLSPSSAYPWSYAGQGAYVDMGYGFSAVGRNLFRGYSTNANATSPQFFEPKTLHLPQWLPADASPTAYLRLPFGSELASEYTVYDTWSFHYENNGVNDDSDVDSTLLIDEGIDGFDNEGHVRVVNRSAYPFVISITNQVAFGVDDPTERETTPPYDTTLRGMQVTLRGYERDSRQIREVKVRQTFVPK